MKAGPFGAANALLCTSARWRRRSRNEGDAARRGERQRVPLVAVGLRAAMNATPGGEAKVEYGRTPPLT
jgi:hypothetical protein